MQHLTIDDYKEAAHAVSEQTTKQPTIGIVLGSGLGEFAESVEGADIIPYSEIPHWPHSTVKGHSGRLHVGQLEGRSVMVMQGRVHYYEGYHMTQVTLPIRVMQLMGVETLILTNAAGGINTTFTAGDLMLIVDHLNLMGMTGGNPLIGPNHEELGPRFPDMSKVYTRRLREAAEQVAADAGILLHKGVYAGLSGPTFETPADIRFLRMAGVDAVGMSTVPEAIVARHGGLDVLGFSGITNEAIDDPNSPRTTNHEEVIEAGKVIAPKLETMLRGVLKQFPE